MTCREKLKIEHPDMISDTAWGGCVSCPSEYGYLPNPEYCGDGECFSCWDREIPQPDKPRILDSGERRKFDTGAVRDIQEGKGRCDLMPLDVLAEHMENSILLFIYQFTTNGNVGHLYRVLDECPSRLDYHVVPTVYLEVSKHFEEGAKKYGENNWQKGIPTHCYVDSAVRHYLKHLRGDTDEPHDRAFVWNILCCIWTCIHKPELNDYGKEVNDEKPV